MSRYDEIFTDSTDHTAYKITIVSENGEMVTLDADDLDVREIMEFAVITKPPQPTATEDRLGEILQKVLLIWKQDYPKRDGGNGLLMEEYFGRLEQSKMEAHTQISNLLSEMGERGGCPCYLVEPCSYACTCARPSMSGGCMRCCKYGSKEQRVKVAQHIAQELKTPTTEEKI